MESSAVKVMAAGLTVAALFALLVYGYEAYQEVRAEGAFQSYLSRAEQFSDAGKEPPAPGEVVLPGNYSIEVGAFQAELRDGARVVRKEPFRGRLTSTFNERKSPPEREFRVGVWQVFNRCPSCPPGELLKGLGSEEQEDYRSYHQGLGTAHHSTNT